MAKQTLKSLLGASDDRVDVNYELNQPTLTPQRIQSGQYSVATQSVAPSQTASLAKSLGQFSGVLKNYSELQQDIGVKMAAGVQDKDLFNELKKEDPESFLTFQRRKSYRNALYKRAINYDILPSLSTDSKELLNLNEFGAETDQFIQKRLDPYLDGKWGEFSEKVGAYADDPAAQAMWIATTSQWRQSMVQNYNNEVENFNIDAQKQELGLEIEAMGQRSVDETGNQLVPDFSSIPQTLQNRDNLLADDNINAVKRTSIMATEVAAQATALLVSGRASDAEKLVTLTENTKINGKPVFKTGAATRTLADVKQRINNTSEQEDIKSSADVRRTYSGQVSTVYEQLDALENIEELDDFTKQTIIETFETINPQITEEQIQASLEAIFNHPTSSSEGYDQVLQEIAISGPDFGNSIYFDTKAEINRQRRDLQNRTVITSSLTESERTEYIKDFTEWKRDNPQKTAKQWISSQDLNIPVFDALRNKDRELSQGNWVFDNTYYKNIDDLFVSAINQIEAETVVNLETDEANVIRSSIGFLQTRFIPDIQKDAVEYARTLDPNLSASEQDNLMRDFVATLSSKNAERIRDFAEAFKKRGMSLSETSLIQKATTLQAAALVRQGGPNVRYDHLTSPANKFSEKYIINERQTMLREGHLPQLGRSLLERGYQTWDSDSYKLLETTGLTAQDVSLFGSEGELDAVTSGWRDVIIKEVSLDDLTEEEEATKDMFNEFGIFDLNTYNVFVAEQRSLLEDND